MIEKILPEFLTDILKNKLDYNYVYEIRIRSQLPIIVNYGGRYYYLNSEGVGGRDDGSIVTDRKMLEAIIYRAADYSMYAVNNQLKHSFITVTGGIRIGICGELVIEDQKIKSVKNFTSLVIRIPHEVNNCALTAYHFIAQDEIYNSLIISPPGCGKTTFLRDIARLLSQSDFIRNTLIIDERYEIASCYNGIPQLNVGKFTDVISNCDKLYGFEQGIRAMKPDVIITDELANQSDLDAVIYAAGCGVKIIASAHAYDHTDLINKPGFDNIIKKRLFERFVVLSNKRGPGTYEGVYDNQFNKIYIP
ncbi:MAG TPA: stage III sporulation protein AA [Clostridiales bacterium]|jgi:stage III sporulation protein AA|nr:stage III sporulation protein AA [Clostridiales bacterium]